MFNLNTSITNLIKHFFLFNIIVFLSISAGQAQTKADTIEKNQKWNFHFQSTAIEQYHPAFSARYSGMNSLLKSEETPVSVTGTIFFGLKLWKGARFYFNPELSGGAGFSKTTGVAGFPNGEVYRVSDPSPHIYIARLYAEQVFPLSGDYEYVEDGFNQLAQLRPVSYIAVSAGKYSVMDFFDKNIYSHDPRTQFYNWALMGNGAWDYPANTRGYTFGLTIELVKPEWALRFSSVMVPLKANGAVMDFNLKRSRSEALEFEHKYSLGSQPGTIRLMGYFTRARMGSYDNALKWGITHDKPPEIDSVGIIGTSKYGFGINIEQSLSKNAGMFLRAGWDDGHNETWTFTEIDRHLSTGLVFNGSLWHRNDDVFGIAQVINGLSEDHKNYLKAGGYGFIIGDGNLNYGMEFITELYYSYKVPHYTFWITPDYQFILNPAYNKDRGPVHVFGIRIHCEL
jgi:high affinity Mn2+ porin